MAEREVIENAEVRLADYLDPPEPGRPYFTLRDKTFRFCFIDGPISLCVTRHVVIKRNQFGMVGDDLRSVFVEYPRGSLMEVNHVITHDVTIEDCQIRNVAFAMTPNDVAKALEHTEET